MISIPREIDGALTARCEQVLLPPACCLVLTRHSHLDSSTAHSCVQLASLRSRVWPRPRLSASADLRVRHRVSSLSPPSCVVRPVLAATASLRGDQAPQPQSSVADARSIDATQCTRASTFPALEHSSTEHTGQRVRRVAGRATHSDPRAAFSSQDSEANGSARGSEKASRLTQRRLAVARDTAQRRFRGLQMSSRHSHRARSVPSDPHLPRCAS